MSSLSIEKSSINDCIKIFSPINCVDNEILILISHGSGGIGAGERFLTKFWIDNGYTVGLLDYFTPHKVKKLYWTDHPLRADDYDATFTQMFTLPVLPYKKVVHIGLSLGAALGIHNANQFVKNFCFYPGMIAATQEHLNTDYNNTICFVAGNDNWCNDYYRAFESQCKTPPKRIDVPKATHGFMIPWKNKTIPVVKYQNPAMLVSKNVFDLLGPNHKILSQHFSYEHQNIRLLYDKKSRIMCNNIMLEEVRDI